MNYTNGLKLWGGRVLCANCNMEIKSLTVVGNEAKLECSACGREWSRQVSAEDIAALIGEDED